MPRHLHLDFETFSKVDLTEVGAYRYAFDPSTEILCAAMALGGEEPCCYAPDKDDEFKQWTIPDKYWDALEDPDTLIYAHNAQFEMAICQALLEKTWGINCPDLRRFRCTMSIARRASLPSPLEKLGEVLGLTAQKDKIGKSLIKKFSIMQPYKKATKHKAEVLPHRIFPKDDPEAFAQFMEYCAQDVRVEQQVAKKLAYFDEPINNANYSLDAVINARGVPVNISALQHAQKLVEQETAIVATKFRAITGLEPTQGVKFKAWVNERGAELPNMQAQTIEEFLEQRAGEIESNPMVQAVYLKASIEYAAVKKIPTMLACAGPNDNRIRGMLNHHGAVTGRWSQSFVQFHNMKRPTDYMAQETKPGSGITNGEEAYRDICKGMSLEEIRFHYGAPLEVISSCIRHFVHDV